MRTIPIGSRIAVTGATGFIGRHVVRALRHAGYRPVVLARSPDHAKQALPEGIEVREADVTLPATLAHGLSGVEAAVHMAGLVSVRARDDAAMRRVNDQGMGNMLAAADRAGLGRILVMSSTSAVGALMADRPWEALDETAPFNLADAGVPYVATKRAGHERALEARRAGAPVIALSPTFVLGPGDTARNGTALVDLIRRGRLPACPDGGINPVDVRDVADAAVAALLCPAPGDHYILAGRDNLTLMALAARVAALAAVRPPRARLPYWIARCAAGMAETLWPDGDLTAAGVRLSRYYWYFNADRAHRDLGFAPRPLDNTLGDTLAWLQASASSAPFRKQELS